MECLKPERDDVKSGTERAVGPALIAPERNDMRLCYSNLACPEWSFEQTVEAVGTFGFDGLEIRLFDGEVVTPALDERSRRRAEVALRESGVEVAALDTSLQVASKDGAEFLAGLDTLSGMAQQWGAPLMRLFGGKLPAEPAARTEALKQAGDLLAEAAPLAGRYGVRLAVETHDDFSSARTVAEVLSYAGGSAGAVYDSHHPHRMGERPEEVLAILGPSMWYVQVKDARAPAGRRPVAAGTSGRGRSARQGAGRLVAGGRLRRLGFSGV